MGPRLIAHDSESSTETMNFSGRMNEGGIFVFEVLLNLLPKGYLPDPRTKPRDHCTFKKHNSMALD